MILQAQLLLIILSHPRFFQHKRTSSSIAASIGTTTAAAAVGDTLACIVLNSNFHYCCCYYFLESIILEMVWSKQQLMIATISLENHAAEWLIVNYVIIPTLLQLTSQLHMIQFTIAIFHLTAIIIIVVLLVSVSQPS